VLNYNFEYNFLNIFKKCVCFVSGEPWNDKSDPDYAPSVLLKFTTKEGNLSGNQALDR